MQKEEAVAWMPTTEESEAKKQDEEKVAHAQDYRSKYEGSMLQSAKAWNLLIDPLPERLQGKVSNVMIGIGRMIASAAIAAMTDGKPEFGFKPGGKSDEQKIPLWKAAVDMVLSESNFLAHQNLFVTDYTVLGMGVYDAYVQMPMRKCRKEKADGTFEFDTKMDFRRPKVGVRARSPWECWFDPNARTLEEISYTWDEEHVSESFFDSNYRKAMDHNGKAKYKHTDAVKEGFKVSFGNTSSELVYRQSDKTGIILGRMQDENGDALRIYANGVLIFDKALQIKERDDGSHTEGMNMLGVSSLCFGGNNHRYDGNLTTHSLYPMGEPFMIRGLETIYQAFANMTIDNWKAANTHLISDPNGVLSKDETLYSSVIVDGQVVTSSLGQVNLAEYKFFKDILDEWCIQLSGMNFKQLFGETSKTAFELSQRIKAQNSRFEYKIRALENGCLLKLGRILLANVMSELTVEDYEMLTEKELKTIKENIKNNKVTAEDFDLIEEAPKRRVRKMFKVPNRVYKEDFSVQKTRKFYADDGEPTLVEDKSLRGKGDSYVPAVGEYLWSQEYIERGAIPDVFVIGSRMLGDEQNIKFAKTTALANYARARVAESATNPDMATNFDLMKIDDEYTRGVDIPKEEVMKDDGGDQEETAQFSKEMEEALNGLPPVPSAGVPPEGGAAFGSPPLQFTANQFTANQLTSPLQGAASGMMGL